MKIIIHILLLTLFYDRLYCSLIISIDTLDVRLCKLMSGHYLF